VVLVVERNESFTRTTTDVEIECLQRRDDKVRVGIGVRGGSGFNVAELSMLEQP
jgi:hypothetical protein